MKNFGNIYFPESLGTSFYSLSEVMSTSPFSDVSINSAVAFEQFEIAILTDLKTIFMKNNLTFMLFPSYPLAKFAKLLRLILLCVS